MSDRFCPKSEREYNYVCNEGYCSAYSVGDSGYCERHGSARFVKRKKLLLKIRWWGLWVVVLPPMAIVVTGELWKLAIWVLLT